MLRDGKGVYFLSIAVCRGGFLKNFEKCKAVKEGNPIFTTNFQSFGAKEGWATDWRGFEGSEFAETEIYRWAVQSSLRAAFKSSFEIKTEIPRYFVGISAPKVPDDSHSNSRDRLQCPECGLDKKSADLPNGCGIKPFIQNPKNRIWLQFAISSQWSGLLWGKIDFCEINSFKLVFLPFQKGNPRRTLKR